MALPAILSGLPLVGKIIDGVIGLIDKVVVDKDEANRIKAEVTRLVYTQDHEKFVKLVEEQASIIRAEATGNWIQRAWRPVLMWVIISIVANNYILAPYLSIWFPESVKMLALPAELWSLMTLGVGGYIGGRTVEKAVESWKEK